MVLSCGDLVGLLRDLNGGAASGNAALSSSLHAQSATITAQNEQMVALLGEVNRLSKRCAELEQSNLTVRQYDGQLQLARDKLNAQSHTHHEMLGILKVAGMAIAAHYMGPNGPDLTALMGPLGGAPGALASAEPAATTTPNAPAAAEQPARDTPRVTAVNSLGDAVKAVGHTLTPATLDRVLACAEQPNAQIPGNVPTLLAVFQILLGCLDDETIQAVKADLGPELMQQLYALMMASRSSSAPAPAP